MRQSRGQLLAVGVFHVIVLLMLSVTHEPWRDEIEMWVMARDASIAEILRLAPDMGTPLLWPLILMPFAKIGLGISTLQILQALLALAAAYLLLFHSRLPVLWKFLILTGYYFSFEYGIVARNYSLGILFLFAIASIESRRLQTPWLYGVLLFLMAQTSVHFWFISAVLTLVIIGEWFTTRRRNLLPIIGLGVLSGLVNLLVLFPTGTGQFSGVLVSNFRPEAAIAVLSGALFPKQNAAIYLIFSFIVWCTYFLALLNRPRVASISILSIVSLLYIFCFKHVGGSWHFGLAFVVMVFSIWLYLEDEPSPRVPRKIRRLSLLSEKLFSLLFPFVLLVNFIPHARMYYVEFTQPHSLASAMGKLIREGGYERYIIAAHPAPVAAAVLGYLPGTKFWYAATEEFGTFMRWDAQHAENRFLEIDEVFSRVKRAFPNWDSPTEPVLVLLNDSVKEPAKYGYLLFEATPEEPWRVIDERYFLYAPIPFARAAAER